MVSEIERKDLQLSYSRLSFDQVKPGNSIVGQERAVAALRLGLSLDRVGYNIFLSGDDGSGRLTAVLEEIGKLDDGLSKLRDAAYGYSPDAQKPQLLLFPRGEASRFQEELTSYRKGLMDQAELMMRWPEQKGFISALPADRNNEDAYKINIVIDNGRSLRRPAVIETHPSHRSLFGFTDEKKAPHLSIHIGSYQAAAGGFLIVNAEELTGDDELWKTMKRYLETTHRALGSGNVRGEMIGDLRPQPIPLLTKLVLIGNESTYDKLIEKDGKFIRYFRIAPEFDYLMPATGKNIEGTVSYLKSVGKDFLPAENKVYSEILRYSTWLAEDRGSLTTELSLLGDLLEEANVHAISERKDHIAAEDVTAALTARNWQASLSEDKINHDIKTGEMVIALDGMKVGIVNGLAVMDRGLSSFGTPCVISVAVAPGSEGIVNIEHEAGLSGGIHDKGMLILEGYLRQHYAQTFPLSLYAGICFEQSYAEVDGDSASLAELYALLSAIAKVPIRQDLAVTGSVSQMGALQPVGGINEKIEGFYKACDTVGLTGYQGVIIPKQNLHSLILSRQVEKAIEEGTFHLYAISELEDGIELLSGLRSGQRDRKGDFPPASFNRRVEDGLRALQKYSQEKS